MFAEKPKQLKDAKCDGCGLHPHTGDCVKQTNQQRRREEMGPRRQILNRQLVKTTDKEEIVRLLQAFGEEQGQLALGSGRGPCRGPMRVVMVMSKEEEEVRQDIGCPRQLLQRRQ